MRKICGLHDQCPSGYEMRYQSKLDRANSTLLSLCNALFRELAGEPLKVFLLALGGRRIPACRGGHENKIDDRDCYCENEHGQEDTHQAAYPWCVVTLTNGGKNHDGKHKLSTQ
jgi:hypothetical protein